MSSERRECFFFVQIQERDECNFIFPVPASKVHNQNLQGAFITSPWFDMIALSLSLPKLAVGSMLECTRCSGGAATPFFPLR